jgi:hypothetical protein
MISGPHHLEVKVIHLVLERYHGRKLLAVTYWMILFHAPIISPHVQGDGIGQDVCMIAL